MTATFRVLSFLCLLAAFIWQIGTETQWASGSHAEEEEKKLNIVFGNISLKSTLPPPEESPSTKVSLDEDASTSDDRFLTENQQPPRKVDANLSEIDELRENVNKNDASPENSVDREASDDDFHQDHSKEETVSMVDNVKESSVEFDMTLLSSTVSYNETSEEDLVSVFNVNCSDGDAKCSTPYVQLERLASPRVEEKGRITISDLITSGVSSSLWNMVKPMKEQNQSNPFPLITFTPFKTAATNSEDFTFNSESSTAVQTSENLIPVEGSAVNKLDPVIDAYTNKSEKSKSSKHSETSNSDRPIRTFVKVLTSTPVETTTKVIIRDDNPIPTTLIPKLLESVTTPLPMDPRQESNTTAADFMSTKIIIDPSPKYEIVTKVVPSSEISEELPELRTPLFSFFTTPFWYNSKINVSEEDIPEEELSKEDISVKVSSSATPRLLSSFRESSSSTEKIPRKLSTSSLDEVIPVSPYISTTSSTTQLYTSTFQPQLNSRYVVKDTTPIIITDREIYIPPPRLTNPGCSSLPICIEITLLDTSWDEFCPQAREFQEFLSKAVSHIIHPIHSHQVVLEAEYCIRSSPVYPVQSSSGVTLALFVTDDSGEYAEKLTEICALILRKWAPTTFRNSVMEVKLFNSELQGTPVPVIPELNSGFVAAVSISAVAGVALCMLCILLVVMKQKLMQGRNSGTGTPAADAYSLDSLSINASFRRRRNRKSARSYLNHAFSDQEIPSHPLNEKSLQNCLKNRELLEEEFKKIAMNMPKLDQIPEGAHVKNRYSNILPNPESRVLLADPSGDPLKCYINANYVKGYAGKASTYIACQAPLPEGIEDFWRMIWEQQCRVIIMLTMFEENGISRCATYFPQSTLVSHPPYGDFQVSLLKKDVYEFYTMSTLRLLDLEKNLFRDVVHLWYTNWPDVGVPKDPSSLIYFAQHCRSFINCNAGPTVVHCSTGTGRTGVFITLDLCMREYDESRSIDILQCVSQLRRDRGGAVQNKDQYILIHEAILEYISRMANQSQRSSIQS